MRKLLASLVVALALFGAACGSNDTGGTVDDDGTTSTSTSTSTSTTVGGSTSSTYKY